MNQDEMAVKIDTLEVRQDKLEKRQDNLEQLTNAFSVMQNEQEHIKEDLGEIKGDVKTLVDKPAKRWDSVVEKVLTVIVGLLVGYLLSGGTF